MRSLTSIHPSWRDGYTRLKPLQPLSTTQIYRCFFVPYLMHVCRVIFRAHIFVLAIKIELLAPIPFLWLKNNKKRCGNLLFFARRNNGFLLQFEFHVTCFLITYRNTLLCDGWCDAIECIYFDENDIYTAHELVLLNDERVSHKFPYCECTRSGWLNFIQAAALVSHIKHRNSTLFSSGDSMKFTEKKLHLYCSKNMLPDCSISFLKSSIEFSANWNKQFNSTPN